MAKTVIAHRIEADGIYRDTITTQFLGPQSDLLKSVASSLPTNCFNLGRIPNHPFPVHMAMEKDLTRLFIRMPELKLNTWFAPFADADGKMTKCSPVFRSTGGSEFQASFIWKVPIPLWLICEFTKPDQNNYRSNQAGYVSTGAMAGGFLIAVQPDGAGFYWVPMGNIHNNGAICWSSNSGLFTHPAITNRTGGSLLERFAKIIDYLNESSWNSDLLTGDSVTRLRSVCSFTMEKGETLPADPTWPKVLRKITADQYARLPLSQLTALGL